MTVAVGVVALIVLPAVYLTVRGRIRRIQRQAQELEALAGTDPVTGVANRRAWDGELPRELSRAQRDPTPVCVAVVDLDGLDDYRASHGPDATERYLRSAVQRWRANLRAGDLLARYNEHEFAVVLPGCEIEQADEVIDRLCASTPGDQRCSAGITYWDGAESPDDLVGRAHGALRKARLGGLNRMVTAPAPAVRKLEDESHRAREA